ncbi:MAG: diacylglycerol kinase [Opitutales bacterium]|nr:diacylglycerol kinase [Opitutales bacterium]
MEKTAVAQGEKGATGLTRIFRAFFYSLDGLRSALMHEAAFRQELFLAIVSIPIACFIPVEATMRALMIVSVLAIMVVELLNSSIEAVVDYISMEKHPLAKRAKDMGSAAVLLSIISAAVVWLMAVVPLFAK